MKMYIANCTNQIQDFQYWMPGSAKIYRQGIPIGQQIQLSGDLTQHDIDAVIEQHAPYGMVNTTEIDRTRAFVGICYSIDKKINMDYVRRAAERNKAVLDARGKVIRQEAAVAVNNAMEEEAQSARTGNVNQLEMTITEDTKGGKDIEVDETTRVTRHEAPAAPTHRRTTSRRKAA